MDKNTKYFTSKRSKKTVTFSQTKEWAWVRMKMEGLGKRVCMGNQNDSRFRQVNKLLGKKINWLTYYLGVSQTSNSFWGFGLCKRETVSGIHTCETNSSTRRLRP